MIRSDVEKKKESRETYIVKREVTGLYKDNYLSDF